METKMTSKWQQIVETRGLLRCLINDLPDVMAEEVKEWVEAVKETLAEARMFGTTNVPDDEDCDSLGEWINEICRNDGMPTLYDSRTPQPA